MNPIINISIVDDHPLFRNGVKEYVSKFNIHVMIEASHGKEFIDKLESSTTQPDICLMDISMPFMNGYETTSVLHTRWPHIKIIAFSFFDHRYNIIQMIKNGAVGYIFKSGPEIQVVEAINSVYQHGHYYSEVFDQSAQNILYSDIELHKELHKKELTFLTHMCVEKTYADVAKILNVSPRTVDGYRDALFAKLNLKSKAGLVLFAVRSGIVDINSLPDHSL